MAVVLAFSQRKKLLSFNFMQLPKKKIIVVWPKANIKNMSPKCIFLDGVFCLAAEELETAFLWKLEYRHKCVTVQHWREECRTLPNVLICILCVSAEIKTGPN